MIFVYVLNYFVNSPWIWSKWYATSTQNMRKKKASLFSFCTLYHISLGSLGRRIFTMKSPSYFSQNGLKMAAFSSNQMLSCNKSSPSIYISTEKAGSPKLFAASFPGACPKQQHGPCRFSLRPARLASSLQAVARTKRSEKQSLFFSMATQTALLEKKETFCEILLNWYIWYIIFICIFLYIWTI